MIYEGPWLIVVLRGDQVVISRVIGPTDLAQAYIDVFWLLYPHDVVRVRKATPYEAAYPPDRPYDPRD